VTPAHRAGVTFFCGGSALRLALLPGAVYIVVVDGGDKCHRQPVFWEPTPLPQTVPRFSGVLAHSLDAKGRLVVPAKFRALLGEKFVLTLAPTMTALALYPSAAWMDNLERLDAEPLKDRQHWAMLSKISRYTIEDAECDGQGRLLIPASLREKVGIEREVVTVGVSRRIDVWAKNRFDGEGPSDDEVAAYLATRGIV